VRDDEARKLLKRITKQARYRFSKEEDADDYTQDLLVKYVESPNQRQSVVHGLIDAYRAETKSQNKLRLRIESVGDDTYRLDQEYLSTIEERMDTVTVLLRLPFTERAILHLYYIRGFTLFEIGEILGLTEGRISQRLSEIQKNLKGLI